MKQLPEFDSPRNWTEDYNKENGKYSCKCSACKESFHGHKRRVICKACYSGMDDITEARITGSLIDGLTGNDFIGLENSPFFSNGNASKDKKAFGTVDTSKWDALPRYKKRYHLLMGSYNKFISVNR